MQTKQKQGMKCNRQFFQPTLKKLLNFFVEIFGQLYIAASLRDAVQANNSYYSKIVKL